MGLNLAQIAPKITPPLGTESPLKKRLFYQIPRAPGPVSYTHLTLPTSDLV